MNIVRDEWLTDRWKIDAIIHERHPYTQREERLPGREWSRGREATGNSEAVGQLAGLCCCFVAVVVLRIVQCQSNNLISSYLI